VFFAVVVAVAAATVVTERNTGDMLCLWKELVDIQCDPVIVNCIFQVNISDMIDSGVRKYNAFTLSELPTVKVR